MSDSHILPGHILLVEDDTVNQIVIKGLLGLLGFTVSVASNGEEALGMLSQENASFNAVLMDIGLPDINGMEVTRRVRTSTYKLRDIPIVALTGHISPNDQQACLDCGMNGFIAKPTTKDMLSEELNKVLKK